jgi:IS30 family transposase
MADGCELDPDTKLTQHDLDEAAYSLNTRPRQTLGWMTPSDKLADALR